MKWLVVWLLFKLIVAVILLQTLLYKFTAHPDSVYIFSSLNMEPAGRIITGVAELIASILLFIPRWSWLGALAALGMISGAIFLHITKLGVEVQHDHGKLFFLAVIVFLFSAMLVWKDRKRIPVLNKWFR